MGVAVGDQPLKSPHSDTRLASGLWRAKLTLRVLVAVGFGACSTTGAFSGAVGAADWAGGGGDGAAVAGAGLGAIAATGAFCGGRGAGGGRRWRCGGGWWLRQNSRKWIFWWWGRWRPPRLSFGRDGVRPQRE